MPLPLWALPFREPRTEIKLINGSCYKYQISYVYDPAKKHSVKKTRAILGKITENGFVPSPKHQLHQALRSPSADIKTYGVFGLFSFLLKDEIPSLRETFGTPLADLLLSFAMARWAYQSLIKRAPFYHAHHFSSECWAVDRATSFNLAEQCVVKEIVAEGGPEHFPLDTESFFNHGGLSQEMQGRFSHHI